MAERQYKYDSMCEDLAEHFLSSEGRIIDSDLRDLAQDIQDAVDTWFACRMADPSEALPSNENVDTS